MSERNVGVRNIGQQT